MISAFPDATQSVFGISTNPIVDAGFIRFSRLISCLVLSSAVPACLRVSLEVVLVVWRTLSQHHSISLRTFFWGSLLILLSLGSLSHIFPIWLRDSLCHPAFKVFRWFFLREKEWISRFLDRHGLESWTIPLWAECSASWVTDPFLTLQIYHTI